MDITHISFTKVVNESDFPGWTDRNSVALFFHETMKPYEDSLEDIQRGLDYAFSTESGKGGFVMIAGVENQIAGALVMLKTGMKGFIPENLLLYVSIAAEMRGCGLGKQLIDLAINECQGSVKLHVDYDNPARRLYERMGFVNKYADMRLYR
jgi:[ribosomal protein S18]-alanine N-acetyltransferase